MSNQSETKQAIASPRSEIVHEANLQSFGDAPNWDVAACGEMVLGAYQQTIP
jgi:hypothetical protein